MSLRDALRLEWRIAFSRTGQPVWFRVLKWIVYLSVAAYFWRTPYLGWWIGGVPALGLIVHVIWRAKTKRWTQPWGGWNDLEVARRSRHTEAPPLDSARGALSASRRARQ